MTHLTLKSGSLFFIPEEKMPKITLDSIFESDETDYTKALEIARNKVFAQAIKEANIKVAEGDESITKQNIWMRYPQEDAPKQGEVYEVPLEFEVGWAYWYQKDEWIRCEHPSNYSSDTTYRQLAYIRREETREDFSKHGFWNGKPSELKSLVWKLDRRIWAKVSCHEATQSWGRQESAKLILDYYETIKRQQSANSAVNLEQPEAKIESHSDQMIHIMNRDMEELQSENSRLKAERERVIKMCEDYDKLLPDREAWSARNILSILNHKDGENGDSSKQQKP